MVVGGSPPEKVGRWSSKKNQIQYGLIFLFLNSLQQICKKGKPISCAETLREVWI